MVSKLVPQVSKVAHPLDGAVQWNQTDLPPNTGSPVSFVAPMFVPLTVPPSPEISWEDAKSSFGGV